MRNVRAVLVMFICASFAAGILGAQTTCQPSFNRIDPAPPQGVPADSSVVVVTVYGACIPTDLNQVVVGFSDSTSDSGLPVRITALQPDHISMTVDTPTVSRPSRRQFSIRVGTATIRTPLFLQINPAANSGSSGGPAANPGQDVEYITRPVALAAIRKVDAKADHAIGLAILANQNSVKTNEQVAALRAASTRLADRFDEYFGTDGNGGSFGGRVSDLEDGMVEHAQAIQQLRDEIDKINRRVLPTSANTTTMPPEELTRLNQRLTALENALNVVLHTKVKTGGKTELGNAAGLHQSPAAQQPNSGWQHFGNQTGPASAPSAQPPSGGYRNPIQ